MTSSEVTLTSKLPYKGTTNVINGTTLPISQVGEAHLETNVQPLSINNAPNLQYNLLPVRQLCHDDDNTCIVSSENSSLHIQDKATGQTLMEGANDHEASQHHPFIKASYWLRQNSIEQIFSL